jgi:hypothetical protein
MKEAHYRETCIAFVMSFVTELMEVLNRVWKRGIHTVNETCYGLAMSGHSQQHSEEH